MRAVWTLPAAVLLLCACAGDGEQEPTAEIEKATERVAKVDQAALESALAEALGKESPPEGLQGAIDAHWEALVSHYEASGKKAWWVDDHGATDRVRDFLTALCNADEDALDPAAYHPERLQAALEAVRAAPREVAPLVHLELLLTATLAQFGTDLANGTVPPEKSRWHIEREKLEPKQVVSRMNDDREVPEILAELRPPHRGYEDLKKALAELRRIEASGGWPQVPKGGLLEVDKRDPRVAAVRERLRVTGELKQRGAPEDPEHFDAALEEAVKTFQQRHGLKADGKVGSGTLAALRVPVERRIAQVRANMERWRWMPRTLGERAVLVNVPGYELHLYRGGERIDQMRVIVGEPDWETPVFDSELNQVIFNPAWNVPRRIATEEIIPSLQENPAFAHRVGLKILDTETGKFVDPYSIDWNALDTSAPLPYRVIQPPGEENPLGQVKFQLPNRYAIYLHDTPKDELFDEPWRAFSHGCVRVERPKELAAFILDGNEEWGQPRIVKTFEGSDHEQVEVAKPPKVYLAYFTAWVDHDGTVRYGPDVYGRDPGVIALLGDASSEKEPAALCRR